MKNKIKYARGQYKIESEKTPARGPGRASGRGNGGRLKFTRAQLAHLEPSHSLRGLAVALNIGQTSVMQWVHDLRYKDPVTKAQLKFPAVRGKMGWVVEREKLITWLEKTGRVLEVKTK